ncbi:MAG: hypothetical protein BKP49_10380 [Treponema sp. CETP13]|nr:MAG: hypothetical protein BKP49_10380 [Treponema sp. CETP13]
MPISLKLTQAIIGISWAVMGIIYLCQKERLEHTIKFYSLALIITFTLPMLQLVREESIPSLLFFMNFESHNIAFLYGPFLYLYVKNILNEPIKGFKKVGIHFIPFVIFYISEFFLKAHVNFSEDVLGQPPVNGISMGGENPIVYIHSAFGAVSVLVYGIVIYKRIVKYRKTVDQFFSSHENDVTLSWLKKLALGYIVLFGLSFAALFILTPSVLTLPLAVAQRVPPQLITNIPLSLFILYFSLNSAGQKIIVTDSSAEKTTSDTSSSGKYKKSIITDEEMEKLTQKLQKFMESSKIYLDSDLTLEKLAKETGITRHILSQVLNEGLHVAFYTFINRLRIAEFEELVRAKKYQSLSIMGLAFECGFRSSSSFYSALKKEKGKTPKQLIKDIEAA